MGDADARCGGGDAGRLVGQGYQGRNMLADALLAAHPNLLVGGTRGAVGRGRVAQLDLPHLEPVAAAVCAAGEDVKGPAVLWAGQPGA